MKKSMVVIFLFLYTATLFAQDLIVTAEGDSLNCKITKTGSDYLYFTFKHKEEFRSTLLPYDQVTFYQQGYFQEAVVPAKKILVNEEFNHWRIALSGGWSYQLAPIGDNTPDDFREYAEKLKSGSHLQANITYFITEPLGLGLNYSVFKTSNMINNVVVTYPSGQTRVGTMSDNISIRYFGPSIYTQLIHAGKKNSLLFGTSIGYFSYHDEGLLIDEYEMKGSTLGYMLDFGYDIGISKKMALGFNITMYNGVISQVEQSINGNTQTITLEQDEKIWLGRIDFSAGLRIVL